MWSVALYVRLSFEDERKKESGSVENQRNFLLHYIQDQSDMTLYSVYEDVQQTGADFERPEFKRLMTDIKSGLVNCIVVKDLSRFGRNFLDSSEYIEQVFPMLGVRFIAINDDFDSMRHENSQSMGVALKNLMNDITLKDLSQRLKTSMRATMREGYYRGTYPPYGYLAEMDEQGKRRLVIDPETAPVVKQIFRWRIEGNGCQKIVQKLNEQGIVPPRKRLYQLGLIQPGKLTLPDKWGISTIKQMIRSPLFLGNMVQHRWERPGVSVKKLVPVDPEDWIIVPNTHEAIVTLEEFEAANNALNTAGESVKKNLSRNNHLRSTSDVFCGLVRCKTCGKHMSRKSVFVTDQSCRIYAYCCTGDVDSLTGTAHDVCEETLKKAVMDTLMAHIALIRCEETPLIRLEKDVRLQSQQKETKMKRKIATLKTFKRSLYEKLMEKQVSEQEYYLQKKQIELQIGALESELTSFASYTEQDIVLDHQDQKWMDFINPFKRKRNFTLEQLHQLVKTIWVSDSQHIEIELAYAFPC